MRSSRSATARQSPLFQVTFSLEPPLPPLPAAWNLTQLDVETGAAKFELYLEVDERPDGVIGRFLYRTDLFERATIRRMVGHFQSSVGAIVADPGQRLSALPLMVETERRQLARLERSAGALPRPGDDSRDVQGRGGSSSGRGGGDQRRPAPDLRSARSPDRPARRSVARARRRPRRTGGRVPDPFARVRRRHSRRTQGRRCVRPARSQPIPPSACDSCWATPAPRSC